MISRWWTLNTDEETTENPRVRDPPTDDIIGGLNRVIDDREAQCKFCDHVVEGDSWSEILERLAEHGEEEHDWTGPRDGWSE